MTKLSVNINKVATIRNARGGNNPNLIKVAKDCEAFGAEITREFKDSDDKFYEHCELSVNGEGFLALAEAKNPCDIEIVHKYKWETMTFNVFEMGTEEAVHRDLRPSALYDPPGSGDECQVSGAVRNRADRGTAEPAHHHLHHHHPL